ncbi:MAG: hypothetical protein VB050_02070 [Geobacteraceae bacterium]|nr:hypothetical protein [Geobacteraceae bacterium]
MFLKKLFGFGKDYSHYLEKGDKYLADERFADARNAYGEALEKLEASEGADLSRIEAIRRKIAHTGNMLGRLNLTEAEHAVSAGDRKKAGEHLNIIMELADDPTLREEAERLQKELGSGSPGESQSEEALDCSSCGGNEVEHEDEDQQGMEVGIAGADRVALYFHTLPGDLPDRYAEMGEEFARGCLYNLEGNGEEALRVFENLAANTENDILDYEKAIIHFHNGDSVKCEELLLKAIGINPANPLCRIGLVQLYSEIGRVREALQVVERMIEADLEPDQARMMQGELYTLLNDELNAIESYSKLLSSPKYAREAAERLVPLLQRQGRTEEAAFLAKKFARGR